MYTLTLLDHLTSAKMAIKLRLLMLRTTGNVKMMMSRKSRGLSAGALRSCKAFEGMMSMRVSLWNNSRIRVELLFERHELLWDNKLWMRAWPLPLALVTSCRRP